MDTDNYAEHACELDREKDGEALKARIEEIQNTCMDLEDDLASSTKDKKHARSAVVSAARDLQFFLDCDPFSYSQVFFMPPDLDADTATLREWINLALKGKLKKARIGLTQVISICQLMIDLVDQELEACR